MQALTPTSVETTKSSLLERLLEIAKSIDYLEKRGKNPDKHYSYVQNVDVVSAIREKLYAAGIVVIPSARNVSNLPFSTRSGAESWLTNVELLYRFRCVETGEEETLTWVGAGSDTGGDKGLYKAFTGGLKYVLLSLFLIPTTDDPERDQLTETENNATQRDAAPRIPLDRAKGIYGLAREAGLAELEDGKPKLSPVFKAKLATLGVDKIGHLNVDQAEDVEAFLKAEKS